MSYRVFGFILRNRKWVQLDLSYSISPKSILGKEAVTPEKADFTRTDQANDPDTFDRHVLNDKHKDIIVSLFAQHFRDKKSTNRQREQVDIVREKGRIEPEGPVKLTVTQLAVVSYDYLELIDYINRLFGKNCRLRAHENQLDAFLADPANDRIVASLYEPPAMAGPAELYYAYNQPGLAAPANYLDPNSTPPQRQTYGNLESRSSVQQTGPTNRSYSGARLYTVSTQPTNTNPHSGLEMSSGLLSGVGDAPGNSLQRDAGAHSKSSPNLLKDL
ncbi:hypothetical protein BJX64DRAFT_286129 [Aspergillus heterothallicus]